MVNRQIPTPTPPKFTFSIFCVLPEEERIYSKFGALGPFSSILLGSCEGAGQNTVLRALFRKRELTEFCAQLGESAKKVGEFALAHKLQ